MMWSRDGSGMTVMTGLLPFSTLEAKKGYQVLVDNDTTHCVQKPYLTHHINRSDQPSVQRLGRRYISLRLFSCR